MAKMAELHAQQTEVTCQHNWTQAVVCADCRDVDRRDCPLELCVECGECFERQVTE